MVEGEKVEPKESNRVTEAPETGAPAEDIITSTVIKSLRAEAPAGVVIIWRASVPAAAELKGVKPALIQRRTRRQELAQNTFVRFSTQKKSSL